METRLICQSVDTQMSTQHNGLRVQVMFLVPEGHINNRMNQFFNFLLHSHPVTSDTLLALSQLMFEMEQETPVTKEKMTHEQLMAIKDYVKNYPLKGAASEYDYVTAMEAAGAGIGKKKKYY